MLTEDDLAQIRKVIREEVKVEVKDSTRTLDHAVRMARMEVQEDISELDDRIKNVEIRIDQAHSEIKGVNNDVKTLKSGQTSMKKDLKYIRKTVDLVVKKYDEGDVTLGKRVKRTEDHLDLSKN